MFRSVFVASLLLVTFLGISEPAAALQTQRASRAYAINPLDAQDCSVYPIAIHISTLDELQPGASTGDLFNGFGSGNFGWLRWIDRPGHTSVTYLVEELQDPTLSFTDFEEASPPGDDTDHYLNADDWAWGLAGISADSADMRDTLIGLVDAGATLRVPIWDVAQGEGSNLAFHIRRFVQIRLAGFRLAAFGFGYGTGCSTGEGACINAVFVGEDPAACPEPADLTIAKSASPDEVQPGQTLTYTLAFSNVGTGPATGVVISDVLPLILTDTHFIYTGAAITPTGGVTYAWQVQDLAPNEGGTITITGQVRPGLAGGFTFTNSVTITGTSAESDTGNNVGMVPVMVPAPSLPPGPPPPPPLIFSPDGTVFEVDSDFHVRLENHAPNTAYDIFLLGSYPTPLCTLTTDGLGMAYDVCHIPPDFPPGFYELISTLPGGGTKVAGGAFIIITRTSHPALSVADGNRWPAGSPIVLQLRDHDRHTQFELYFNGALIGTTNATDVYGDVDFPWVIPAGTPPREVDPPYDLYTLAHGTVTPTVASSFLYVTYPQIVVQGGNVWPAGTTLRANLRRHAPNRSYEVRCNGTSVGSFTIDSNGQSMSTILCTIPVGAPDSPPYYTITSYDGGVLIGQVNVTVSTPVPPYLVIVGGYEWPAGLPIEIQLYHHQASRNYRIYFGPWTANSSLTTDGSGSAQTAYIIPITATQATTYSLRSYDLLTHQTIASHTVTVRAAPLINVSEGASVQAGSMIHINLTGHAQNAVYTILLNGTVLSSVQTDNNGLATLAYDLRNFSSIGGSFVLESRLNTTRVAQTSLTIVAAEQIHLPIIFKRG